MLEPTEREIACESGPLLTRMWESDDSGWIALIVHGYGEHSGRYQWLAEELVSKGAAVCAPDLIGHGRSPGDRAMFSNASSVVADLETIRQTMVAEHPDLPVVLFGHSLGGMFAVRYAQTHQQHLAALVLSSPVLGTWHTLDLLECDQIPDVPIDPTTLSRDPEVGRRYSEDPLVWHGKFKRPTLKTIDRCLQNINDGPALRIPTLWIHGEEDELVPEADTRTGIDRVRGPEFQEHIYPGARHELFNETNRDDVINDVGAFLTRQLKT